eukprot:gene21768-28169_t
MKPCENLFYKWFYFDPFEQTSMVNNSKSKNGRAATAPEIKNILIKKSSPRLTMVSNHFESNQSSPKSTGGNFEVSSNFFSSKSLEMTNKVNVYYDPFDKSIPISQDKLQSTSSVKVDEELRIFFRFPLRMAVCKRHGMSALMAAIKYDEFSMAQYIVKQTQGMDLDIENSSGHTALTLAVRLGKFNFVELLIQYGAHVNKETHSGRTALIEACRTPVENTAIVELLIKSSAIVRYKSIKHKRSALDWARLMKYGDSYRILELGGIVQSQICDFDKLKELIEIGDKFDPNNDNDANINESDNTEAETKEIEDAEWDSDADEAGDGYWLKGEWVPIQKSRKNWWEKSSGDGKVIGTIHSRPLNTFGMKRSKLSFLEILSLGMNDIAAGIYTVDKGWVGPNDPEDVFGESHNEMMKLYNDESDKIKKFREERKRIRMISRAVKLQKSGGEEMIDAIIKRDVRKCMTLAQYYSVSIDTETMDRDGSYLTPLIMAADENVVATNHAYMVNDDNQPCLQVEYLLDRFDYRPTIDIESKDGYTALIKASSLNRYHVVEALLDRGSNVNHVNKIGRTALHYAVEVGSSECTRILLERGATSDIKDNNNCSPYDIADDWGFLHIMKLLSQFKSGYLGVIRKKRGRVYETESCPY